MEDNKDKSKEELTKMLDGMLDEILDGLDIFNDEDEEDNLDMFKGNDKGKED